MVASDTQLDVRSYGESDQDRELLRRIVQSPLFAKSPRLSDFLNYVCALAEQGRANEINEQAIGAAVFGRDPDYDATIDSIVRSHASRLRHRLRDYFETDGVDERWVLTIPKGSYIPWMAARPEAVPQVPPAEPPSALVEQGDRAHDQRREVPLLAQAIAPARRRSRSRLPITLAVVALLILAGTCALLFGRHWRGGRGAHLMSSEMLKGSTPTIVVGSDSALVILQHLTGHPVSLSAYTSHEYLRDISASSLPPDQIRRFATRRYMPVVDNSIYEKVVTVFADEGGRAAFRYARDLRPEELKQGNAILLGSRESNPWVQLFEPSMNFYFEDNLETGVSTMLNRSPKPGEQPRYDSTDTDSDHTVYGLVVYRPNLTKTGHVLILEGLTTAGTQTAADFVLDDASLATFLKTIRRPDGSVPHFELLLRSTSIGGESSRMETVAYRVSNDL